jgi:hypothetical protein
MKPKFNSKDFKDMKYDVMSVPLTKDVFSKYPELAQYEELQPKGTASEKRSQYFLAFHDMVVRYVILMYSCENVIHRNIPELIYQKREAAFLAGFELERNGKFSKRVESIIMGDNENVNRMIVRVISFNRNSDYELLITYRDAFERQQLNLRSQDKDSKPGDVKTIVDSLKILSAQIKELELALLNQDTNENLLDKLYSDIEGVRFGITVEENAALLRDGKFLSFHGDKYKKK